MFMLGNPLKQCSYSTHKVLLLIPLLLLFFMQSFSQREADRWYFGKHCGLDFATGEPQIIHDNPLSLGFSGVGTICDSVSNLLFFNSSRRVYNSQHEIMENGEFEEQGYGRQSNVIVPWPGSDSLYFIFKVWHIQSTPYGSGLYYNVVDMSENNGLGKVILKDVPLEQAKDASDQLFVAKHKNNRDIWVIVKKWVDQEYAAFLITPDGINETPVLSPTQGPLYNPDTHITKLSYDKKFLFTVSHLMNDWIEINEFNSETGEISFLYNSENDYNPYGLEFSPDSKYAYVSFIDSPSHEIFLMQYDMQYVNDWAQFRDSAVVLGGNVGRDLQLATDGKIYCLDEWSESQWVGAINKPWIKGVGCDYQPNALNMAPGIVTHSIPVMLLDYLYRFEFEGVCQGEEFQFTSNFNPVPESIYWTFNDPMSGTNHSNELNPTHIFSNGGNFEVEVDVWYPSGRFEHTSRVVEVEYAPEPNLGPDTTICKTSDIILNAECGPHAYLWSTGNFGTSHITVSDTGWYWVEVTSDGGCIGYDSIYISKHEIPLVDSSNFILSPTTCGGSTGAIRGLEIVGVPPYLYQWFDDLGNPIATTLDLYQLPVGNYTLQVKDGNDCNTEFGPYSIIDVGDVLVEGVSFNMEHCDQLDAYIIVTATSGLGDMLYYSIDNGANYVQNLGVFTGLSAGTYAVRVQDSTLCEDAYVNNPIVIDNLASPEITDVLITPATVGQNDGAINITSISSGDTIYYSNDAGTTTQINNGLFSNLFGGYYTCVVTDEFGCDTTFIVEVPEDITVRLQAVAGDDEVCPGNSAFVPLIVSEFNDVGSFKTTLLFNEELIICQGFANAHSQLEDSLEIFLFPAEGKIELNWASTAVTLTDNTVIADLVFQANDQGISFVEWDGSAGAGFFKNSTGLSIPVDYFLGIVKVYTEVDFSIWGSNEICTGEMLQLGPAIWASNGLTTYLWTYPDGDTSTNKNLNINNIQPNQSGTYSLLLTDTVECTAENTVDIIVLPTPYPEFAVQDTIFTDDPIDLDAGYGFLHYLWNTGDTTQMIWVEEDGWYLAEVESSEGCVGEDSSFVVFSTPIPPELIIISFPNAFTPNGDGLNDEFKVVTPSTNVEVFSLSIFNRWGAMVFQTKDITKGWDGTYQGTMCPQGSYVFKVSYNTSIHSNTPPEVKMGTVMLVR